MVLGVIVTQVGDAGLPVDEELTLAFAVSYPHRCVGQRTGDWDSNQIVSASVDG